jgi:hypothetical protein
MTTYNLTSTIPTNIKTGDILNCPYIGASKIITLPKGALSWKFGEHKEVPIAQLTMEVKAINLPFRFKVGGEIVEASAAYTKVEGEWKDISAVYYRSGGTWQDS